MGLEIEADKQAPTARRRLVVIGGSTHMTLFGDRSLLEIAQRAEDGMLPILQAQPGFRAYSLASTGDEIVSLSVWDTAEQAESANAVAASWVAENIADRIELVDAKIGEVLLSTTLGVHAAAGAGA